MKKYKSCRTEHDLHNIFDVTPFPRSNVGRFFWALIVEQHFEVCEFKEIVSHHCCNYLDVILCCCNVCVCISMYVCVCMFACISNWSQRFEVNPSDVDSAL